MPSSESWTSPGDLISELQKPSSPSTPTISLVPTVTERNFDPRHAEALASANRRLPVTVMLNERYWFNSFVDERRAQFWPRFSNVAFYCNVEARVWARIVVSEPMDPHHRTWHTYHVECSPRYRRGWGARYPGSFFPGQPFAEFQDCYGFFPREFWERELLIKSLNLKGEHERDSESFRSLCASVRL